MSHCAACVSVAQCTSSGGAPFAPAFAAAINCRAAPALATAAHISMFGWLVYRKLAFGAAADGTGQCQMRLACVGMYVRLLELKPQSTADNVNADSVHPFCVYT